MRTVPPSVDATVDEGVLLERTSQLGALQQHFAAVAQSGRGRLVLLSGGAGVGKTALVRSFCGSRPGSTSVVTGSCDALITPRPLGPFLDIAPMLAGEMVTRVQGGGRPHEVADGLMAALRSQPPTIVVIEDVHWADEATLDVIRLVGRRVESIPAMVVVTYRDDLDRKYPLRVLLGELTPSAVIGRLRLGALSADAVSALAAPTEWMRTICSERPPATRSSSPRCWRPAEAPRFHQRSATRCSLVPLVSRRRR